MTKTKKRSNTYALVFSSAEDKNEAVEIASDFGKIVSRKFSKNENVLYANARQRKEIDKHKLRYNLGVLAQSPINNGIGIRK